MYIKKVKENLKQQMKTFDNVTVWGAGSFGKQVLTEFLKDIDIKAVVDINKGSKGLDIMGIPIISPDEFLRLNYDCVIVCVDAHRKVFSFLKNEKFKGKAFFIWGLLIDRNKKTGELQNLFVDLLIQKDRSWLEFLIFKPQIIVNITYRLARHTKEKFPYIFSLFFRILHSFSCSFFSIFVPDTVKAGPGLVFQHYGCIVVHPKATLGAFCTLYQGTTIGSNYSGEVPTIADYITLYSGSMVLGDTYLADYASVGANSVAIDLKCFEPEKTIVGQPAKII